MTSAAQAHVPRPALALAIVADDAETVPSTPPPESATLPASARVAFAPVVASRLYVAASPLHDYWAEVVAAGPIEAAESAELRDAPVGPLLCTDHPTDPERGMIVAERVLGGGWVLATGTGV